MSQSAAAQPCRAGRIAVVGAGPAGLMAAEVLLRGGASVDLYDAMPSAGRKFLLAGKGGLNLTHSEPLSAFIERYDSRACEVARWLNAFGPQAVRDWAAHLGVQTFVGSSGRVFPTEMKAAPLLRAWLHRLRAAGLRAHMRHRWVGFAADESVALPDAANAGAPVLCLQTPNGGLSLRAEAVVLALGGASWPQLGSDGAWWPWLHERGVDLAPLQPANGGFDVAWSDYFIQRFAGAPLKSVRLMVVDDAGRRFDRPGEFVVSAYGIEGSLVYAASSLIRDQIALTGSATVHIDLVPGRDLARLAAALAKGRGARSLPNHLREQTGLDGVKAALLRERWSADELSQRVAHAPAALAAEIKAWPLRLTAARPLAEVISTAGGVRFDAVDERGMLKALPGVFCAGEMLDWEAPTGGYLLTACLASGRACGQGVLDWMDARSLPATPSPPTP